MIPGHGGIMDRFDCQFLMATFVNVYISSFIRTASPQKLLAQVCTAQCNKIPIKLNLIACENVCCSRQNTCKSFFKKNIFIFTIGLQSKTRATTTIIPSVEGKST